MLPGDPPHAEAVLVPQPFVAGAVVAPILSGFCSGFLPDPFGMQVPWSTLELLAKTGAVEVIINFPVGMAIQRLLRRDAKLTPNIRAKLDDYFGDSGWYDVVYSAEQDLFGDVVRKADDAADRLVEWYRRRLKAAFGHASPARLIKNSHGGHLYYLVFAGPNETGLKIATQVLLKKDTPV